MEWTWDFPNIFWPFLGVWALIALAILAFDVWMLIDAIQRPASDFSSSDAKTWWIVGLVVGMVTGLPAIAVALAYYFIVRRPAVDGSTPTSAAPQGHPPPPVPPAGATGGTTTGRPPSPARQPLHCPNCGTKVAAGARYCHSCGRALD